MFLFAQWSPPLLSWMVLGTNGTVWPPGRTDTYQDQYDYNKKGSFGSENFMPCVQHCMIAVQRNISSACSSLIIIDGINKHFSHEKIQHARYVFTVLYIQVTYITTPNANDPLCCFIMFYKVRTNTRPLPDAPSGSAVLRSWLGRPTRRMCYNPKTLSRYDLWRISSRCPKPNSAFTRQWPTRW